MFDVEEVVEVFGGYLCFPLSPFGNAKHSTNADVEKGCYFVDVGLFSVPVFAAVQQNCYYASQKDSFLCWGVDGSAAEDMSECAKYV